MPASRASRASCCSGRVIERTTSRQSPNSRMPARTSQPSVVMCQRVISGGGGSVATRHMSPWRIASEKRSRRSRGIAAPRGPWSSSATQRRTSAAGRSIDRAIAADRPASQRSPELGGGRAALSEKRTSRMPMPCGAAGSAKLARRSAVRTGGRKGGGLKKVTATARTAMMRIAARTRPERRKRIERPPRIVSRPGGRRRRADSLRRGRCGSGRGRHGRRACGAGG